MLLLLPLNNFPPFLPSSSRRRNRTSTDVDEPDRGSSSSTCGGVAEGVGSSIHREIVFRVSSGKCSRAIRCTKAVIPLCELAPPSSLSLSSFSNPPPVICSSDSFPMSTQFPPRISPNAWLPSGERGPFLSERRMEVTKGRMRYYGYWNVEGRKWYTDSFPPPFIRISNK